MKVLYLGHYKEGTGWSVAAINNILALNTQDIDLVTRNVKLTKEVEVPKEILELEKKDLQNIDVCIQHVLPHHLVATNKFKKNIAYFVNETNTIKYASSWWQQLKSMDEVWVPCVDSETSLINDGIQNVKIVPHTFNTAELVRNPDIRATSLIHENFKFYYIGDTNDRKNLSNIIRCFHVAFSPSEPVDLVLKLGSSRGIDYLTQSINATVEKIKRQLRLHGDLQVYKKEHIISQHLDRQAILDLHSVCDCYIAPSHGEAWNIPAFEAMAFGNTPICSACGGPKDFIDKHNVNTGTLVSGVQKICNHQDAAFPFLGTGREMWFEPDDEEIIKAMRYYFENRNNIDRNQGIKQANMFSHKNIGELMMEYLK